MSKSRHKGGCTAVHARAEPDYYAAVADELHGCLQKNKGNLRLVSGPGQCGPSEIFVTWSTEGPQGPQGEQGIQGNIGSSGLDGVDGVTGPQGDTGAIGGSSRDGVPITCLKRI